MTQQGRIHEWVRAFPCASVEHEKVVELKPKDETDKEGFEEYEALIEHIQKVHDQIVEMLKFCENSEGGINITQLMYSIVSGYFPNLEKE